MIKKSIIKYISISLIITQLLCVNVSAATVYTEGALNYIIENGTIVITKYFGTDPDVVIPSSINNAPVVEIAKGAFDDSNAKTIIIPDTVTNIEEGAIPKDVKREIVSGTTSIYDDEEYQEEINNDNNNEKPTDEKKENEDKQEEIKDVDEEDEVEEFEPVNGEDEIVESGDVSIEDQEETNNTNTNTSEDIIAKTNNLDTFGYIFIVVGIISLIIYIKKKKRND